MEEATQTKKTSGRVLSVFLFATRSSFWLLCVDLYPAVIAASLPWSTSAVSIFSVVWLFVLIPSVEPRSFLLSLRRPAYWLPLAFFALAVLGVLWVDGSWSVGVQGLNPLAKLLILPFLLYHFVLPRELGAHSFPEFLYFATHLFVDNLRRTCLAHCDRSRL
jgi:hypothetical protein